MVLLNLKSAAILLFYLVAVDITDSQAIANDEWFADNKRQYKCHCEKGCNSDGTCVNKTFCSKGWFGLKCQNQDLATIIGSTVTSGTEILTDRNDTTCLGNNVQTVDITFNMTYVFTWIRVVVKNPSLLSNLTVQFRKNISPTAATIKCNQPKIFLINQVTLDMKCDLAEVVQKVSITGVGVTSLCSFYINGGRNVALKQTASQTSNYSNDNGADKAVDGNTDSDFKQNSCTHTDDKNDNNPMWTVQFGYSEITRYVLYNRNEYLERLAGFVLEAKENEKMKFNYTNTPPTNSTVYTVFDPSKANVNKVDIKVTGTSPILTLCEVEIYGECTAVTWGLDCQKCPAQCSDTCHIDGGSCNMVCFGFSNPPVCNKGCDPGFYGINCTQKCPGNNCYECSSVSGQCYRCQPGYRGNDCKDVCALGNWGIDCNKTCDNCKDKNCNIVDGLCKNDCLPGFQHPGCLKDCDDGRWGVNCLQNCSEKCKSQPCNKTTGYCPGGCVAGFESPFCNASCKAGKWGENCAHDCNDQCQNKSCDTASGLCTNGCIAGFKPPKCTEGCDTGNYGVSCLQNCSTGCQGLKCNSSTGFCFPCKPGYQGDKCDQKCPNGLWGDKCSQTCSPHCYNVSCHHMDGNCSYGCLDGYQSRNCSQKCDVKTYGRNCSLNCSTNCTDQRCNHVNGTCDKCYPGYKGNFCDKYCSDRTYGQNCSSPCNTTCLLQLCHPVNGACNECKDGRYGDQCETCPNGRYGKKCLETCSDYCNVTNTCQPEDGVCLNGCQVGYNGSICKTPCVGKHYGANCQKICNDGCQSNESTTCHHITGYCLLGCKGGYSGDYCFEDSNSDVGAIVGGILAAVAVLALIAVGVILWRRKHQKSSKNAEDTHRDFTRLERRNSFNNQETNETDVDSAYCNVPAVMENTKIAVDKLSGYLKTHKIETLAEQYRKIPKPKNVSTEIGQSNDNKHKNRYKNICPYDHTRVNLMVNAEKQEGGYINASYIRDNRNEVKFIAAQGPYNAVLNDFVRMLWEQKTEKVVMLTNLIEEGKAKCEKYWPDSGKTMFGEIKVKLKETHQFADYTIRKIELEKKDETTRILTHYHFTSWPDQGVPLTPWALVDFEQKVDANKATIPIVVHCSAGVGRTGTFIALHNIMRQAEETGYVDFYSTLAKLREDRVLMIQTADQYIFLHKAAQAAIICIGTTVTSSDIRMRIKHLEENALMGISNMEKEFNNVCSTCTDRETQTENADAIYQNTESVNSERTTDERNRFPSITPRDSYRPYLNCETQEMGSYINAVFVPGFQKKDQHLLTQLPLPTTFIDFWRLITQYNVSLVVAFEVDSMMNDKTIANYLPSGNQPIMSSPVEIHSESIKEDSLWEEQTLKVTLNNSKSGPHSLIHLKCKDTDLNARKLLNFVNKSRSYNAQVDGRILYTCRNGATFSGLACVLSLLLDRMDHDSCLTVPLVVGSIKSIRPEVIPTFEQYKMLYEALQRYNETTATYSNMDESVFLKTSQAVKGISPQSHTDDGNVYHNM